MGGIKYFNLDTLRGGIILAEKDPFSAAREKALGTVATQVWNRLAIKLVDQHTSPDDVL